MWTPIFSRGILRFSSPLLSPARLALNLPPSRRRVPTSFVVLSSSSYIGLFKCRLAACHPREYFSNCLLAFRRYSRFTPYILLLLLQFRELDELRNGLGTDFVIGICGSWLAAPASSSGILHPGNWVLIKTRKSRENGAIWCTGILPQDAAAQMKMLGAECSLAQRNED